MKRSLSLVLATLVLGFIAPVWAGIELEPSPAVVGQESTIVATSKSGEPLAEAPVKATYYPNSEVKRVVEVGRTDLSGSLAWTPDYAGLTALSVGDQTTTVGVRFTGMPLGALVIFLIAGTLLFGGIAFGVARLR